MGLNIRLADQDERRTGLALKQSLHSGKGNRLMIRDHAPLAITCWEQLEHTRDQSGDHSHP